MKQKFNQKKDSKEQTLAVEFIYKASIKKSQPLFLASSKISAGFPSPAEPYVDKALDLNEHLIQHPSSTFFIRVSGNSMIGAGIYDQDILIVDKSLEPLPNKIVIAVVDGEMTVKRLKKNAAGDFLLASENPDYPAIALKEGSEVSIWGVVTTVIHPV